MKSAESSRKSGFQTEHEICPAVDGATYMSGVGYPWSECTKVLTNFRMYASLVVRVRNDSKSENKTCLTVGDYPFDVPT